MLGRAINRARGIQLRHLTSIPRKFTPLNSAHAFRAFTTQNLADLKNLELETPLKIEIHEKEDYISNIEQSIAAGNVPKAIKIVQKAKDLGLATPELYQSLLETMSAAPFDIHCASIISQWFYSKDSTLPDSVMNNISIWKNLLKMSFHFGNTHKKEDLRALLEIYTQKFDLNALNDQEAWELCIKGWGIFGKSKEVYRYFDQAENRVADKTSFYENAVLSFAMINNEGKVQEIFTNLKNENAISHSLLDRLAQVYAFKGSIERTAYYKNVATELFPGVEDKTVLLMAHKTALGNIAKKLGKSRGSRGLSLKPQGTSEIDNIHTSWKSLTDEIINGDQPLDITDFNIILEYMTISNRIDPIEHPMENARAFFDNYMPKHGTKPNNISLNIMIQGYSWTHQYKNTGRNIRLDKALEMIYKMREYNIKIQDSVAFQGLFHACLPHRNNEYYFDYFKSTSLLPLQAKRNYDLDRRIFEIEKIMFDLELPHNRITLTTMLTCLAAGGKFEAFNNRWNTLRVHGFSPDGDLYRLVFELSALDPDQSKFAVRQIRQDMLKDITDKNKIDFKLNCAILNCCITAQLPQDAKVVIDFIRKKLEYNEKKKTPQNDQRWLPYNSSAVYHTLLNTSALIKGLGVNTVIREMNDKGIEYTQDIWVTMLTKYAVDNDYKNIRRLFNKYTMSRFEKTGSIPIPVRDASPIIPFPSAPYNLLDVQFINVYISTLIDTQNISLVFDVLRTWSDQTPNLSINRSVLAGVIKLAKNEKDMQSLKWFASEILPKSVDKSKQFRRLQQHVNHFIQKN